MSISQRFNNPAGPPMDLQVERMATPGQYLDWTNATGTPPNVDVSACVFSTSPAAQTLALVESPSGSGLFPIELTGTVLSQWTPGKFYFTPLGGSGAAAGGGEVVITGGADWVPSAFRVAGGRVTACTAGTNGTITLSGYLPAPTNAYNGMRLRGIAGAFDTQETGVCTLHTNTGSNTATFQFANCPTVAADGTVECFVKGLS